MRPPTPITDQVTARNTRAATSRHPAPSASSSFGTDAALSRVRCRDATGRWTGIGAVVKGTATAGTDWVRSRASSSSARVSVVNRPCAVSPVRVSPQVGHDETPGVIAPLQSGQRRGSA